MNESHRHLAIKDKALSSLFEKYGYHEPSGRGSLLEQLVRITISQQLSSKASNTIYNRLLDMSDNLNIDQLFALNFDEFLKAGVSKSKASTIKSISKLISQRSENSILSLDKESISNLLLSIKGFGPWSLNMFLIFGLEEKNIFPRNDIGVINGIKRVYSIGNENLNSFLDEKEALWSPYCSIACYYMWKAIDDINWS